MKMKNKDYYWLFVKKSTPLVTALSKWEQDLSSNDIGKSKANQIYVQREQTQRILLYTHSQDTCVEERTSPLWSIE